MTINHDKPTCRARIFKTHEARHSLDAGKGVPQCGRNATLDGYCWQHHPNWKPAHATLNEWPPEEVLP